MNAESGEQQIRIILAEDHHVFREALHTHLERQPRFDVVAEVSEGSQLLSTAEAQQADVLLMDLKMPHHNPVVTVQQLRRRCPALKIIVLSAHKVPDQVIALFREGIAGYVLKDDPADTLVTAVKQVAAGQQWISPQAASILVSGLDEPADTDSSLLTPRQQEVLLLMARGYRNEEIAQELVLSEHTVRNHIVNIFRRLNVDTRVEAVVHGLAKGLIAVTDVEMDGD
ncbi:MAG: response regulator transcription factor [Candidatus Promineifilaceae bacterium]|nr:response regulator transcription factor [Candidatus Promineifilaceae bacterium]